MTYVCRSADSAGMQNFRIISDRIHDMWFQIDALTFDPKAGYAKLPLSNQNGGPVQLVLECSGIEDIFVKDTEKIGGYDVNYLSLNQKTLELKIICNIPIKISIRLHDVWELSLSDTTGGEVK